MPQYRQLHLKILDSYDVAEMPDDSCRFFWVTLPLVLDSEGRGIDNPAWLRSKLYPIRDDITLDQISGWMDWLAGRGMITRYEVGGRGYFYATKFKTYQRGTEKEAKSVLPAPFDLLSTNSGATQEQVRVNADADSMQKQCSGAAANSPYIRAYKTILSITSWTAIPVGNDEQISIMQSICNKHGEGALDYCRPYYDEYRKRYPKSNRLGWVDWAATGQIPDNKQQPKRGGMLRMEV